MNISTLKHKEINSMEYIEQKKEVVVQWYFNIINKKKIKSD